MLLDQVEQIERDADELARAVDAFNAGRGSPDAIVFAGQQLTRSVSDADTFPCLAASTVYDVLLEVQQLGLKLGGYAILLQAIRFGQDGWFDRFATSFESSFNTVYTFADDTVTEAIDLSNVLSCYDDGGLVGTGFYSSTATSFPGRANNCRNFEVGTLVRLDPDPATLQVWTRMKFRIELGRDPTSQEMQEFTTLLADAYREQFEAAHG